jgi:thiamine pyrophosphate-dependent acetolactate synthase large subunit-like protein
MSDPKGPVYLCGVREVLEQEIKPYNLTQNFWSPVGTTALPLSAIKTVSEALTSAENPLIITGYSGRNHLVPGELVSLADQIPHLRVLDTGGSDMCFPANHPAWLGLRYGVDPAIESADVILVLDCDVPWVNTRCKPSSTAKIYHIDIDPLKQQMPVFYIDALGRWRADSYTALVQLREYISANKLTNQNAQSKRLVLEKDYNSRLEAFSQVKPAENGTYGADYLCNLLKKHCPAEKTLWIIEAVTSTLFVADQLQVNLPGSWLNCGGGGLGWSGGASLGVKLASVVNGEKKIVVQIVGDGTFLFSVPGSVYWIARRYGIPTLTIVLNNKGWKAPKNSLLLVHPDGLGSKVKNDNELYTAFDPTPDYAGIAQAAAGGKDHLWAVRCGKADQLEDVLKDAVKKVEGGMSVVLDAHLGGSDGKVLES